MASLKNIPFLSLILLFITYSTFGWYIERGSPILHQIILDHSLSWGWNWILKSLVVSEKMAVIGLVYGLASGVIILITFCLMAPVALVTFLFGSTFKQNGWSILSILLWSFALVVMLRWFPFVAQLLLLICAAMLAKLDLQNNGYPQLLVFSIITMTCFIGFVVGAIAHSFHG